MTASWSPTPTPGRTAPTGGPTIPTRGPTAPTRSAPALALASVAALLIGFGGATAAAETGRAVAAGPPVVSESFTLLPCTSASTTLAIEGCLEHKVVSLDKQINKLAATIYYKLAGPAARSSFVASANRWVKLRRTTCLHQSDANYGGSLAPIDYAQCEVTQDRARIASLTKRLHELP
jgi:uncharacterized protein YecT (DUF1311 family)